MPYIKKNTPSGPDAFEASYYISKFKEIYGDRYKYFPEDFDKREIGTRNRDLSIRIECTHGVKNINVRKHLQGYECRYCKGTMIDKTVKQPRVAKERKKPIAGWNIKVDKSSFINKAVTVHGNRYSYDKFIYVNCRTKELLHAIYMEILNRMQTAILMQGPAVHTVDLVELIASGILGIIQK